MADLISLSSFTCHWSQIFICCVPLSHCHLKVKPFPYRNDRWCDPSFPLLFGLGWQKSDHGLLPVMCLAAKERREGIACPWQDRYTLMGHYTLHNLLKPSSELSKHIRVYIINSNFSWTLFVHSQPCMAEVKSFFYGKHCHYTPSCCRERERGRRWQRHIEGHGGWRRLNTNCFQERRCRLSVCERARMCEQLWVSERHKYWYLSF